MIYLASPYSHPDPSIREARFKAACGAAAAIIRSGQHVFSPIAHSHPIAAYGLPTDWSYWEKAARAHLKTSAEVVVLTLDGWQESLGVAAEVCIATELGIPVRYLPLEA
jgi:hypothetical protein